MPVQVLEAVRNISFLSKMLELYSEIIARRKAFGIGHMYVFTFLLRMTYTMTSRNIEFSSWDIQYTLIIQARLAACYTSVV
jgi:hypothetical protein